MTWSQWKRFSSLLSLVDFQRLSDQLVRQRVRVGPGRRVASRTTCHLPAGAFQSRHPSLKLAVRSMTFDGSTSPVAGTARMAMSREKPNDCPLFPQPR